MPGKILLKEEKKKPVAHVRSSLRRQQPHQVDCTQQTPLLLDKDR